MFQSPDRRWWITLAIGIAMIVMPADLFAGGPLCVHVVNDEQNKDVPDATEFFGPVYQPARIIDPPIAYVTFNYYSVQGVDIDGDSMFVVGTVRKTNVWSTIVWFWPELLLGLLVLLSLITAWRIRRAIARQQVVGEPYCRKCNYRLTGSDAKACPECGVTLTDRTRVIGTHRSLVRPIAVLLLLLGGGGYLGYLWYPPVTEDVDGYGGGSDLPRWGVVSEWFNWHSRKLYEWTDTLNENSFWHEYGTAEYGQMWRYDLWSGELVETVADYPLHVMPSPSDSDVRLTPPGPADPVINRVGELRILNTHAERHLFDAKRGIYATIPYGDWFHEPGALPLGIRWSHDGRYLYDGETFTVPVMWDTTTWQDPVKCPVDIYRHGGKPSTVSLEMIRVIPDDTTTAVIVKQIHRPFSTDRLFLWNPMTSEVRDLPIILRKYDTHFYAMTANERFIVGEQWRGEPEALVWDRKRIEQGDDEPLLVPYEEFFETGSGDIPHIAAIARQGQVLYFYNDHFIAWHLDTGKVVHLDAPPPDEKIHWISKARPKLLPLEAVYSSSAGGIRVRTMYTNDTSETITTPMSVLNPGMMKLNLILAANDRIVCGRVGNAIVLYDRKTNKWLGRFIFKTAKAQQCEMVQINDDATLMVVGVDGKTTGGKSSLMVFELPPLD